MYHACEFGDPHVTQAILFIFLIAALYFITFTNNDM